MQHWENAWAATKADRDGRARAIADFTLANWSRLLAALGQVDQLGSLLQEAQDRTATEPGLQQLVNAEQSGCEAMRRNTDASFRCGTFALSSVAWAMKVPSFNPRALTTVPSPVMGFSMTKLLQLAQSVGADMVAAQWSGAQVPVVPSVVHWKQNHYGAILALKNGYCPVADPALGSEPHWLTAAEIADEASGYLSCAERPVARRVAVSGDRPDRLRPRPRGIHPGDFRSK